MNNGIHLLEVVALLDDIPSAQLVRGQVGTVAELLSDGAYEVEFCDDQGKTYAVLPLKAEQLIVLHHSPLAAS